MDVDRWARLRGPGVRPARAEGPGARDRTRDRQKLSSALLASASASIAMRIVMRSAYKVTDQPCHLPVSSAKRLRMATDSSGQLDVSAKGGQRRRA